MIASFAIRRPDGSIVLESIAETSAEAWRRAVKYCAIRRAGPDSSGYKLVRVKVEELLQQVREVKQGIETRDETDNACLIQTA